MFVGISGLPMDGDYFDLGDGITIKRTYAHLMMPYVVAFKRPEPGMAHPGPWEAAEQPIGFDIEAELYVPEKVDGANDWEIARALTFLLRLGINPAGAAPLMASHSLEEFPTLKSGETRKLTPLEVRRRSFPLVAQGSLNATNAKWLGERWRIVHKLSKASAGFDLAMAAMDAGQFERNTAFTLVSLWGALEALFAGDRNELKFRVSSNIAAYIVEFGPDRGAYQKEVARIYDKRSAAVHGVPKHDNDDVLNTFTVMRAALMKMIETGKVPTREDLEKRLFGE
jgi:hypothetical protein